MKITNVKGVYREDGTGLRDSLLRYTLVVAHSSHPREETEEVDVDARDKKHAREIGAEALRQEYTPGLIIVRVVGPRTGLYL